MDWFLLYLAIACEITGTFSLKMVSAGKTPFLAGVLLGYIGAFSAFGLCIKTLDVGVAYSIWAGVGIVGMTLLGTIHFQESVNPTKMLFIGLITIGAIGLNAVAKG